MLDRLPAVLPCRPAGRHTGALSTRPPMQLLRRSWNRRTLTVSRWSSCSSSVVARLLPPPPPFVFRFDGFITIIIPSADRPFRRLRCFTCHFYYWYS